MGALRQRYGGGGVIRRFANGGSADEDPLPPPTRVRPQDRGRLVQYRPGEPPIWISEDADPNDPDAVAVSDEPATEPVTPYSPTAYGATRAPSTGPSTGRVSGQPGGRGGALARANGTADPPADPNINPTTGQRPDTGSAAEDLRALRRAIILQLPTPEARQQARTRLDEATQALVNRYNTRPDTRGRPRSSTTRSNGCARNAASASAPSRTQSTACPP